MTAESDIIAINLIAIFQGHFLCNERKIKQKKKFFNHGSSCNLRFNSKRLDRCSSREESEVLV